MKPTLKLTKEQLCKAHNFANALPPFTNTQWQHSYQRWYLGGRAWNCLQMGGTQQMRVLMWYHHVHRPNSKEWRPTIIIRALMEVLAP